MTTRAVPVPRDARAQDVEQLVTLWGLLFDGVSGQGSAWRDHARAWFDEMVWSHETACFPVVESGGQIVACAIGTLELGVPNPHSPRGRVVRLANLMTLPEHRGQGYATALVRFVVEWARVIQADRVDLSATPEGERIYRREGFLPTSAPRMKLAL